MIEALAKYVTALDDDVIEVHFARETVVYERFSVTMPGWQEIRMLTMYDGAYANNDRCLVRTEAIVWSRTMRVQRWFEIDNENLIPMQSIGKDLARLIANHLSHELDYSGEGEDTDSCGVSKRFIAGYGSVYRVEG